MLKRCYRAACFQAQPWRILTRKISETGIRHSDSTEEFLTEMEARLSAVKTSLPSKDPDIGTKYRELFRTFESSEGVCSLVKEKEKPRLGTIYRGVSVAYGRSLRLPESIRVCMKALELHRQHFGNGSRAEAADRRVLAIAYNAEGEFEKSLQQYKLMKEIQENEPTKEACPVDLGIANCLTELKKYDEAMAIFKNLLQKAEAESSLKAFVHVRLAEVYFSKDMEDEGVEQVGYAYNILNEKKDERTTMAAQGMQELAKFFEVDEDYETAVRLLKDAIAVYEELPGQHCCLTATQSEAGTILCAMEEREEEGIELLYKAAELMRKCFGDDHPAVAAVLAITSGTYMKMKKFSAAVIDLNKAKKIYNTTFGSGDEGSILINSSLVVAYTALSRYDKAIKCQKEVIEELQRHNLSVVKEKEILKQLLHAMTSLLHSKTFAL